MAASLPLFLILFFFLFLSLLSFSGFKRPSTSGTL
jgi:hypothetical protein